MKLDVHAYLQAITEMRSCENMQQYLTVGMSSTPKHVKIIRVQSHALLITGVGTVGISHSL